MNAVLVPLVARREEPTLEGAAARASGVDVEAPRLDCSADEWHDSERLRERRNQPSWVSGPRANASDAGLCNMARRRFPASSNFASVCGFREPPLRFRHETFCGAYMKPPQFAASVGLGYGIGDSTRNVPIGIVVPRFLLNYYIPWTGRGSARQVRGNR